MRWLPPAAAAISVALSLTLCACVTEAPNDPRLPSKPDLKQAALTNTDLGMRYAAQGQFEVAEVKLKKALEQDDGLAQAHAGLGYVYWQRGNNDGAESEFHRALELSPDDPDTRNNYGIFLCGQKQYAEGDRNFMLVLKNSNYSTPAKAWTNAGLCARQAGDPARAEDDFRKALQGDTSYPPALSEMATISYQQQNYLAARAFLERYLKIAPQTPQLLLLGYKVERALENDDAANQYSVKLVRSYPESDEAAQLLKLRAAP
jgi:type IV pilus assembly protein PilF